MRMFGSTAKYTPLLSVNNLYGRPSVLLCNVAQEYDKEQIVKYILLYTRKIIY